VPGRHKASGHQNTAIQNALFEKAGRFFCSRIWPVLIVQSGTGAGAKLLTKKLVNQTHYSFLVNNKPCLRQTRYGAFWE